MEEALKKKLKQVLSDLNEIILEIQNNKLKNEQYILDFMDELNKISVMF